MKDHAPAVERDGCERTGVALVGALVLALAMLLVSHGLLTLSAHDLRASQVRARYVRSTVTVRSALVRAARDSIDDVLKATPVGAATALAAVPGVELALRRAAGRIWVIEGRPVGSGIAGGIGLPLWVVDASDPLYASSFPPGGVSDGVWRWGSVGFAQARERGFAVNGGLVRPAPAAAAGLCLATDSMNWGDPSGAVLPCSTHRVVVRASGPAHLVDGVGQGVLLVDGDLVVERTTFRGVVVATGTIELRSGAEITGWVHGTDGVTIQPGGRVVASRTVAAEALLLPPLRRPFVILPVRWLRAVH